MADTELNEEERADFFMQYFNMKGCAHSMVG